MYEIITDFLNCPGLIMSVCIVGNITAPPKQNSIVPNATKIELKHNLNSLF